jgi:hypothetical protein
MELSQAEVDVLEERRKQVIEKGWTDRHDDGHDQYALQHAAAAYALQDHWHPRGRRENLIRAAALMLAAIEKLDRESAAQSTQIQLDLPKP